ncbi:MAG TPA: GYF domain-containing protein [Fimbriiglobus sp.]|nr:GYF domain-containing protein [Fimbriiglobus sp.]
MALAQQWFVVRGDREEGPYTGRQLKQLAASGKLKPDDQVRRGDVETVRRAKDIKGLFPAPPPVPADADRPARKVGEDDEAMQATAKRKPVVPLASRKSGDGDEAKQAAKRKKVVLLASGVGLCFVMCCGGFGALFLFGSRQQEATKKELAEADRLRGAGDTDGADGSFPTEDPRYAVEVPDFSKVDYTYDFSKDDYDTLPAGARPTTRDREIKSGSRDLIGKIETEEGYIDSSGKFVAHGKFVTWYDKMAGRKFREGTVLHDRTHGVITYYYEDGTKSQETCFVDQKEHGVWRSWHKNGKPSSVIAYVHGKRHGRAEGWYEDGTRELEYTWVEGKRHGPQKEWWDNGGRKRFDPRKDGARHGYYADWEQDGKSGAHGLFEDGRPVGKHRLAYIEARTDRRYYLDVDDQPWMGGTIAEFIAKMHYIMMRNRPHLQLQFDPRAGIATFVADSGEQFFESFGRPASDSQDPEKLGAPAPLRAQYRRWRYDLRDGSLHLRVQPTQDRTLLITAKR